MMAWDEMCFNGFKQMMCIFRLPHLVVKTVAVLHSAARAFPRLTRIFLATGKTGVLYNWTTEWCGDIQCLR